MRALVVATFFSCILSLVPLLSHAQIPVGGFVALGIPCVNDAIHVTYISAGLPPIPLVYQEGVTIPFLVSPKLLAKTGTWFVGVASLAKTVCITPKGGSIPGFLLLTVGTGP